MMKTFEQWVKDTYDEELHFPVIDGSWFAERGLPMIVHCSCCESTLALPSAMINEEGYTYCRGCAE